MANNKRNFFRSAKVRNMSFIYILFSILIVALLLGWESFTKILTPYLSDNSNVLSASRGLFPVIKVVLLLIWGMLSFLLSYTYLDVKFLGVFRRMDTLFNKMEGDSSLELKFRNNDGFSFLADSFKSMKNMLISRIAKRKKVIEDINQQIESLPSNPPEEQLQKIITLIDDELQQ